MVAGATGVAAEATVEAGFMPRSEDFMDQAPALVVAIMALLRIMVARYI